MILFYLLIFVMPLTQHRIWSRFVGELTVVKYVGVACLLYTIVHLAARRAVPDYFRSWQARLFVIFYLIAAASYFYRKAPASWDPFFSYTSFLLLFFVTVTVVDSMHRLRRVLLVAIGSAGFASLYVLREWQKYHTINPDLRPGWVVGDANYFTVSALMCLPLAFYLMLEQGPRWEKAFCLGCLVVTLGAVTLAASRGGFLGLVVGFLFVVWRSRRRVRNLALVGALLIPVIVAAPTSPLERLLHPTVHDQGSAEIRKKLWKAGIQMIQANPFLGVGLGGFKGTVGQYAPPDEPLSNVAHSVYIEIAAEMGVPGLLAYLIMLCSSYWSMERLRRQPLPSLLHQVALGIQAGLIGYSVSALFLSAQYQKLFWFMMFLTMCLPVLARSALAVQEGRRQSNVATA